MYTSLVLISILLSLVLRLMLKLKNGYYWKKKRVNFERPYLFVGNAAELVLFRKCMGSLLRDFYFKFTGERFFGMWILTVPQLVIRCPDLIKQVLIKDFDHFSDRNVTCNEEVDPVGANTMFVMTNPKWRSIRAKTTHLFSSNKIKYIYPQIEIVAKKLVSFIDSRRSTGLDVKDISTKYSTEVIFSIAFAIDARSFQDADTQFTTIGKQIFAPTLRNAFIGATYFCKSSLVETFKIKIVPTSAANVLSEVFLDLLERRELSNDNRRDLLNVMIEFKNEYKLSENELVAQAAQFFIAGYDTTSAVISFALYEISLNKCIQDKLRKEIMENENQTGDVSYSALNGMNYLDRIISETLRKYPPLPFLGRTCTKDYKIPQTDIVIDKGTSVMIPIMGLHYDPKYFPNPQEFDPERFSEENVKTMNPFSYLPFGEGQRNCVGKRIGIITAKLALFHILKNYELAIDLRTKIPLVFNPKTFMLYPNPMYIKFKRLE